MGDFHGRLLEEKRIRQLGRQDRLLGFELLDGLRERLQLHALLVRELARLLRRLGGHGLPRVAFCFLDRGRRHRGFRGLFLLPVVVAADVVGHAALALEDEQARANLVKERAIVAHEQHGAAEFHEQILEQFERLRVEIVGGLVEHEHVARLGEQPREQQPVALAARERLDRGARARRVEKKILEIGNHVPVAAVDGHGGVAVGHGVLHAHRLVELRAKLVEVDDLELGALLDGAGLRRELAEEQAEQRGLARAVGADDADLVAALDARREIAHNPAAVVGVAEARVLALDHLEAAAIRLLRGDRRLAGAVAARGALGAHLLERVDAVARARALRLHAAADPDFLLRELLVELRALHFLGLEHGLLAREKRVVVALPADELAAIDLDDARGNLPEKRAIVGHEQQRPAPLEQKFLQPQDRLEIEMVGRLVEQQQLRRLDEAARQQHAAFLPGGERGELVLGGQAHLLEQPLATVVALPVVVLLVGTAFALDDRAHGAGEAGRHFLPQGREYCARLAKHLARVSLELARDDFHQRGLARAVAADETDALAAINLEIDAIEQRRATEAQADIEKTDNGHGNRSASRRPVPGARAAWP